MSASSACFKINSMFKFFKALSPYDPRHNSTILFVPGNGKNRNSGIYSGTVSDFAGNDPLIYWKPLSFDSDGVRTQRDDVKILDCKVSYILTVMNSGFC